MPNLVILLRRLLPRDAMLARYMMSSCVIRRSVCLSVRPPVTRWSSIRRRLNRWWRKQRRTIDKEKLVFWCQWSWRNSNGYRTGRSKWRFSTNISLYLRNIARLGHGYYEKPIAARMSSIDDYFQWPEITLTTPNHPIFYILYRLSYLRSEWR